jgi:glutathione S-transferase/RNA polymerase-associated protein
MLKLYEHPLSPYAQKVKIALYEKAIPFDAIVPDLFGGTDGRFMSSSPRHEVPTVIDAGVEIFDSTIILEYLEDKWPEPAMLPESPEERARVRMLEELCDTYYEAINWGIAEIRFFGRAKGELAETMLARAGEQIGKMQTRLEREIGDRDFFNGDEFGWGDLAVYPHVAGSALHGFPPVEGSQLAAWLAQVSERQSVSSCSEAAMQALQTFQNLEPIVEQGLLKREYRDHRLEWVLRSGGMQIVVDGLKKNNIRFSVELD